MNRRVLALLFVLVLLPAPATSVHTEHPDPLEPREVPDWVSTGYPIVEGPRQDALEEANGGLLSLYDAVTPTARPALDAAPQAAITLFRDGVMDDPRFGALEDWQGNGGWTAQDAHAFAGDWAFAVGDGDGYPTRTTGSTSALVTPELDLRTSIFADQQVASNTPGSGGTPDDELVAVEYETPQAERNGSVTVREKVTPGQLEESVSIPAVDSRCTRNLSDRLGRDDVDQRHEDAGEPVPGYGDRCATSTATDDSTFMLEYWARHNLGVGADGVQVWVLHDRDSQPDPRELFDCIANCTRVQPRWVEGSRPEQGEAGFTSGEAYTGAAEWGRHYVDLSPWAQERVWVVFVLRTSPNPQGSDYFQEGPFFQHEDFFGFQFDEVQLHGTPGPTNLQLRSLVLPTEDDSFDTATDIPVRTFIRNTGPVTLGARTTIEITDPTLEEGQSPLDPAVYSRALETVVLPPGYVHPIRETFPALGEDRSDLRAVVTIEAVADPGHLGPFMTPDTGAALRPLEDEREFVGPLLPVGSDDAFDAARDATPTEQGPLRQAGQTLEENAPDTIPEEGHEEIDAADEQVGSVAGHPRDHVDRSEAASDGPTPVSLPQDMELEADTNPDDNVQSASFDVTRFRRVTLSEARLTEPWVDLGEELGFSVVARNEGTVAEQVTVLPNVLDVDNGNIDVTFDLLGADVARTTTLAPDEAKTLSWELDTSIKGHYKIYAHTSDHPSYHPRVDFPASRTLSLLLADGAPVVDGDLSDDAWTAATLETLVFEASDGSTRTVDAALMNTATDLYLSLTIPDGTHDVEQDPADDDHQDVLKLYFDDHGDLHLEDGEDALWIGPAGADGAPLVQDRAYDAASQTWGPGAEAGETARVYDEDAQAYVVELRRPLNSNELGGLHAEAGERVGLVAVLQSLVEGQEEAAHVFPAGASVVDDPAGDPLDESLDDEARQWAALELAAEVEPFGGYALSPVFGIGTGAGPVLHFDFGKQCPPNWKALQNGPAISFNGVQVGRDEWQCDYYPPEGKNLLFVGLRSNGALCGTSACLPYAGGNGDYETNYYTDEAVLETNPILINSKEPYLVIRHQYATPVHFVDPIEGQASSSGGDVSVNGIAYITAHVGDRTFYLTPGSNDDIDTRYFEHEESLGIHDPRFGPDGRDFADRQNAGFGNGGQSYCRDDENLETEGINGPRQPPNCGWWHPTGDQDYSRIAGAYRPSDDQYPVGQTFHGSPWKIDRIPLVGTHWNIVDGNGNLEQPYELDLRGQDVRFRFHYVLASERGIQSINPDLDPPKDYGWRISDLAITDGISTVNDLAVLDAELATPYDATAIGVGAGPGAGVPVDMTIGNVGLLPLSGAQAVVDCLDGDTGQLRGRGTSSLDRLEPGQTVDVQVACVISAPGGRVRIEARVEAEAPDDSPFNDVIPIDGLYHVTPSPDLEVSVRASPETSSVGFRRSLLVDLHNRGNVPLSNFDVTLQVNQGAANGPSRTWTVHSEVPVGGTLRLDPSVATTPDLFSTSLRHNPADPGSYRVIANVAVAGDVDARNDRAASGFRAVNTLYASEFEGPAQTDVPGLVAGGPSIEGDFWQVTEKAGAGVLRAGDGEALPAESDGSYVLPPIDVTSADGATVVLRHAYDLETGYDAARVEATTDGETWKPLVPKSTPGQPRGYPDEVLVGSNPLLGTQPEARAAAFTGSSADHATADEDGFISTEYDLVDFPDLQATRRFADFPLDELADHGTTPVDDVDGTVYYTDSTWTTSRVLDGWLIDNGTLNGPRPHSGETMWWSNSAGEFVQERLPSKVDTTLSLPIDLTGVDDDQGVVFTFWDWRAGWRDTELKGDRSGSGGLFELRATGHAAGGPLASKTVQSAADGWTQREVDLSSFAGGTVDLQFRYVSSRNLGDEGHRNNIGWFLDDVKLQSFLLTKGERTNIQLLFGDDLEGRAADGCSGAGPYTVGRAAGADDLCWELVERGLERPGAWHIDQVTGPDGREARAWRIASDDPMGYPNLLDSRLVTPPVDLRRTAGQSASLTFDHRYDLEASQEEEMTRAIDGGVVEYQVYDERSSSFGEWKQLTPNEVGRMILEVHQEGITRDSYPGIPLSDSLAASGYSAVYTRGLMYARGDTYPAGLGDPFNVYSGFCDGCYSVGGGLVTPHPVGYAFSGQQDWNRQTFDVSHLVGEKVRFAFHAWSNPLDFEEGFADPRLGWDITNVAVEGTVFDGKPVQLRLRAATDESVLTGHWTIDRVDVSGAIQPRNLALSAEGGDALRFPTSTGIEFPVDVLNLGTQPRTGVALAVRAVRQDTGALLDVDLEHPDAADLDVQAVRDPRPGETVSGPVVLTDVGSKGDRATWTVRVPDAGSGVRVSIQARILEDQGSDQIVDGKLVYTPDYALPREPTLANTRAAWTAVVDDAPVLSFEPQRGDMPLRVDGAGPGSTGDVLVQGLLRNEGPLDSTFALQWTLEPSVGTRTPLPEGDTTVPGGGTAPVGLRLEGLPPGTYRATATTPDGPSASIEFPVGRSESLWVEGFDQPLSTGWTVGGNTDEQTQERRQRAEAIQWRVGSEEDDMDGTLYWGVHPLSAEGYCDGNNLACGSDIDGVLATAATPPLDLSRTLNGRATLTLDHSFFFSLNDGGRVSVAVVDENGDPLDCDGDSRTWMPLEPAAGADHDGVTRGGRFGGPAPIDNPLGTGVPVFQGPQGTITLPSQTTYNLLGRVWCEGGSIDGGTSEVPLEDATVRLRLEVGIRDLQQPRRPGWQVDKVALSSGGVSLGPTTDGAVRVVDMIRNAPKRIAFEVENLGLADDEYVIEAEFPDEPGAITLEDDRIPLRGGERGLVWVAVDTTEGLPIGDHRLVLRARSLHDPDTATILTSLLSIQPREKPDLSVSINPETGYEQDSITVVPLRIDNLGSVPSKKTLVKLEAKPEGGTYQTIETLEVPSVCAPSVCGPIQSRVVVNAEWAVPSSTGAYTLRATVDPKQHLLDLVPENNVFETQVQVVPLQLPDLVVTSLEVEGADGRFLDDDSVVTTTATIRNEGQVPARGATARILAGSVTLTETPIPVLVPGAEFEVSATQVVGGKSDTLDIIALVTGGTEIRTDNNEQVRTFQVRTHDVRLVVRDGLAARAGGLSVVPVEVQNLGNSLERLTLTASGPEDWTVRVATPDLTVPPEGSLTGLVILEVPEGATAGKRLLPVSLLANGLTVASTLAPVEVATQLAPAKLEYQPSELSSGDGVLEVVLTSRSNVDQTVRVKDNLGWIEETLVELEALATRTVQLPLRVPTETPPGTYDDRIHVAALDGTWEDAVDQTWTVRTTLAVDAAWTDAAVLDAPGNGTRLLRMRLSLENLGNVVTTVGATAETAEGTSVAPVVPVSLEPLEPRVLDVLVYVDERLATPSGELVLNLSGGGEQTNRSVPLPDLRHQPDLVVVSAAVDDARPRSGEPTTVRALLRNDGTATARPSTAHLYADGLLVAVADVPALAVGEDAGVTFEWTPLRGGPNHLVVLADGGGRLLELHKDNNGHALELRVDETDMVADLFRGAPAPAASLLLLALALLATRRRRA